MTKIPLPNYVFVLVTSGCANLSVRAVEQPLISLIDIQEANFLDDALAQDPKLKGLYKVLPDRQETRVVFKAPSRPQDEASFRGFMSEIKGTLTKSRGRPANTIVAVFPEKEYRF